MTKLLGFIILLISSTAFARLGTEFFHHSLSAHTEAELLTKIDQTIPLIIKGKIKSVFQNNCWPNNDRTIKVRSVSTRQSYRYEHGRLNPFYIGRIDYLHKKCRD